MNNLEYITDKIADFMGNISIICLSIAFAIFSVFGLLLFIAYLITLITTNI